MSKKRQIILQKVEKQFLIFFSARFRAINMCHFLLEKGGVSGIGKAYDATDLFVHSVFTYFEESAHSTKCKKALQGLIAFICDLQGQRHGLESRVHHLVMDWLADPDTPINVGIGAKVMSFITNDKVSYTRYHLRFF